MPRHVWPVSLVGAMIIGGALVLAFTDSGAGRGLGMFLIGAGLISAIAVGFYAIGRSEDRARERGEI